MAPPQPRWRTWMRATCPALHPGRPRSPTLALTLLSLCRAPSPRVRRRPGRNPHYSVVTCEGERKGGVEGRGARGEELEPDAISPPRPSCQDRPAPSLLEVPRRPSRSGSAGTLMPSASPSSRRCSCEGCLTTTPRHAVHEEGRARRKPSLTKGATTTPRTREPWGSGASTGLATADPASSTTPPPAVVREGPWTPTPHRRRRGNAVTARRVRGRLHHRRVHQLLRLTARHVVPVCTACRAEDRGIIVTGCRNDALEPCTATKPQATVATFPLHRVLGLRAAILQVLR
jgi:hypothetical protein